MKGHSVLSVYELLTCAVYLVVCNALCGSVQNCFVHCKSFS